MNKFAFFFPAKVVFAERNIELEQLIFRGQTFYLGPIGKNIYFSSDTGKIVVSSDNSDENTRWILVKIGEYFCQMKNCLISNIEEFLDKHFDFIQETLPKWQGYIDNPSIYEQEQTERREKIKSERAIQDAEIEKRNQERREKTEQLYQNSLKEFSAGQMIVWEHFERATKQFAVRLPIKTLGFGRKNVAKIGHTGYSVCGSNHNSPILWQAIRELQSKMLIEKTHY